MRAQATASVDAAQRRSTVAATATTYRVLDTDVRVPMTVERAVAGLTVLAGDADAIDAALPDDLAPVRLPAGRGVVLLLAVDYLDNPLGDYDEVVVGLAARPVGIRGGPVAGTLDVLRGRFGACIQHMGVNQEFTREAGGAIWGYPKTLDDIAFDPDGRSVADELAALGLDRRPVAAAWLSDVRMHFDTARPLHRAEETTP